MANVTVWFISECDYSVPIAQALLRTIPATLHSTTYSDAPGSSIWLSCRTKAAFLAHEAPGNWRRSLIYASAGIDGSEYRHDPLISPKAYIVLGLPSCFESGPYARKGCNRTFAQIRRSTWEPS
jgi:hypothetical protein